MKIGTGTLRIAVYARSARTTPLYIGSGWIAYAFATHLPTYIWVGERHLHILPTPHPQG